MSIKTGFGAKGAIVFLVFFAVFVIGNAEFAHSSGCCLVEPYLCSDVANVYTCCGIPSADNENFEYCSQSLFLDGEQCGQVGECEQGCCCYGEGYSFLGSKSACDEVGGTLYAAGDCSKVCGDPTSPTVGTCDFSTNPLSDISFRRDFSGSPAKILISWTDKCLSNIKHYEIYRNDVLIGNSFTNYFEDTGRTNIDEGEGFLFGERYNYKIKAVYYDHQGSERTHELERRNIYSGDMECWLNPTVGFSDFCIKEHFYETYMAYFGYTDKGDFWSVFRDEARYMDKMQKGYRCSKDYVLFEKVSCTPDKPCSIRGTEAVCADSSPCIDYNQQLGLVVNKPACNQNVGCFYEHGTGLAGLCLDCKDTVSSCYGYASRDSCLIDNCNVAFEAGCDWISINDDLGIGVCIDNSMFSCSDCYSEFQGNPYASCALIYDDPRFSHCVYCLAITSCLDYSDRESCTGDQSAVIDTNTHEIRRSNDLCGLGVCNYFDYAEIGVSMCQKDIDLVPGSPDCEGYGGDPCELDMFPPQANVIFSGIQNNFRIDEKLEFLVIDKTGIHDSYYLISPGSDKMLPTGYYIHICIDGKNCHSEHKAWVKTQKVEFTACELIDLVGFDFTAESQTLRYFASDPAGNVAKVQSVTFISRPDLFCQEGETRLCELQEGVCKESMHECNVVCGTYGFFKESCIVEDYENHSEFYEPIEVTLDDGLDNNCDGIIDLHPKNCWRDEEGLILDTDGDGICDNYDNCPNTTEGCEVQGYNDGTDPGCPKDCEQEECVEDLYCIYCDSDADCDDGLACCAERCVNTSINNNHCGVCDNPCDQEFEFCFDSSCVECANDLDCDEGYICDGGVCIEKPEEPCEVDEDCQLGEVCQGGICVAEPPDPCESNDDCQPGHFCFNGTCRYDGHPLECERDAAGKIIDSDNDGICDTLDLCPNTPEGCPVQNYTDEFPGCAAYCDDILCEHDAICSKDPSDHPDECEIDEFGWVIDSDNDGICDALDMCQDTPEGCEVQDYGEENPGCAADCESPLCKKDKICALQPSDHPSECERDESGWVIDSDNDGICDALDMCQDTPEDCEVQGYNDSMPGCAADCMDPFCKKDKYCFLAPQNHPDECEVDELGWVIDSDGDGICDALDLCQDTSEGCEVQGYNDMSPGCAADCDMPECTDDAFCRKLDKCERDAFGNIIDSDGDGICDGVDVCENTLPGCPVYPYSHRLAGCPSDCSHPRCIGDTYCDCLSCDDCMTSFPVCDASKCKFCNFGMCAIGDFDGFEKCYDCSRFVKCSDYLSEADCERNPCLATRECDWVNNSCVLAGTIDRPPSKDQCFNGILDGDETDVDCGGSCNPCSEGKACIVDSDCRSGLCSEGVCEYPGNCFDGIQNQGESDVDCGGPCDPCEDGLGCFEDLDCESGFCNDGKCASPTCFDKIQNQGESDVDCGGPCTPCNVGKQCNRDSDCASEVCDPITAKCVERDSNEVPIKPPLDPYDDEEPRKGFPWLLLIIILALIGAVGFLVYYFRGPIDDFMESSKLAPAYRKVKEFFAKAREFIENLLAKLGLNIVKKPSREDYYHPASWDSQQSIASLQRPSQQASQKPSAPAQQPQLRKPAKKKTLDKKIRDDSEIFDIFEEPKKK